MAWKDFWFGVIAALGAEFLLAIAGFAVLVVRSRKPAKRKIAKAAGTARHG